MVDTHQLYERIKILPDDLVKQVAEYVDFLMLKNKVELNPSGEFFYIFHHEFTYYIRL